MSVFGLIVEMVKIWGWKKIDKKIQTIQQIWRRGNKDRTKMKKKNQPPCQKHHDNIVDSSDQNRDITSSCLCPRQPDEAPADSHSISWIWPLRSCCLKCPPRPPPHGAGAAAAATDMSSVVPNYTGISSQFDTVRRHSAAGNGTLCRNKVVRSALGTNVFIRQLERPRLASVWWKPFKKEFHNRP